MDRIPPALLLQSYVVPGLPVPLIYESLVYTNAKHPVTDVQPFAWISDECLWPTIRCDWPCLSG